MDAPRPACAAGLPLSLVLYIARFTQVLREAGTDDRLMGLLDNIQKLRETLTKTREGIARESRPACEHAEDDRRGTLEGLEEILIGADVGTATTTHVIDAHTEAGRRRRARRNPLRSIGPLKEEIARQLRGAGPG